MEISLENDTSSPASSPTCSIFSNDAASSQSSVTSASSKSVDGVWDSDDVLSAIPNHPQLSTTGVRHEIARVESYSGEADNLLTREFESLLWRNPVESIPVSGPQQVLPISARRHPRRTQPQSGVRSQDGSLDASRSRPPPSLVRQDVRKDNFVDGLVGEHFRILLFQR